MDYIKYFENIIELERYVYLREKTYCQLSNKIDSLSYRQVYREQKIEKPDFVSTVGVTAIACGIIAGIIGAIIGIVYLFNADDYLLNRLWRPIANFISFGFFAGLGGLVLGVIIFAVLYGNAKKQMEEEKKRVERLNSNEITRISKSKKGGQIYRLEELKNQVASDYYSAKELLEKYYNCGILYPKYCNFIAVCSFYDYFSSGVCNKLTGHEGAYNKYDTELLLNRILIKLDEILEHLEDIKDNQRKLYDTMKSVDSKVDRLVSNSIQMTKLAEYTANNTAIAADSAQQAANEARFTNWLLVYNNL